MKKLCFLFAGVLLLVAGCSQESEETSGSESTNEDVTLSYMVWDLDQMPALEQIIEEFNTEFPHISIELENTPFSQYWDSLEIAGTGQSLPDVFWMNGPNVKLFAENDMLLPISERVEEDSYDLSPYPEALLELYNVNENQYAIPKDYDTIGLWYNKELFDETSIDYPDESWDWDSLIAAAQKLTNVDEGVYGIAAHLNSQSGFYNTIYQAGGYVIDTENNTAGHNTNEGIEGIKFWVDLIHKYEVSPSIQQMTDNPPTSMFESGNVAMFVSGSWFAPVFATNEYTKDRVDVAQLPSGKEKSTIIHGLGNVISSHTEHPDEAWEFLKFLGSERAAEIQAESGTVIPAYEGIETKWVESLPNFNAQAFIDQLDYAEPLPNSLQTRTWQQIELDYLNKAWTGEVEVEELVDEMVNEIEEILANE
ncbi:ABC transporter substrate-binding protein [Alteribacter populi]|uniref:ABC transporter substrate-binding protein n=1 Tax=Alteribacter populi TaxID=2011011 RepID=UPI000BBA44EE|nr:sugar ABC transporter substrate-binding protein [Alteribacter populi]